MNRHSKTSAATQKDDLTAKRSPIARIHDVQKTATSVWIHEQLNRIRKLIVKHGADSEMLDTIDHLAEDNWGWIDEEIAARLGCACMREA